MALNFSHRPIFSAHRSEDKIVQGGSQDTDIHELLPADPFGMDISSTVTAITGWLEDLGASDCSGEISVNDFDYNYPLFTGWEIWFNTAASMEFGAWNKRVDDTKLMKGYDDDINGGIRFEGSKCSTTTSSGCFDDDAQNEVGGVDDYLQDEGDLESLGYNVGVEFDCCNARFDKVDCYVEDVVGIDTNDDGDDDDDDGAPHPALSFVLAYLGVRDLLSVERVCKSLRVAVQTDTLLWRSIHIDHPLNERITDDILLELTNRAQGHLQCLSLVVCKWITDDGLKRVLDSNKELTKLSVPGCTRLSIDGVLECLRSFTPNAVFGIKYLRVGGLFGVTLNHFEEIVSLLGIHNQVPSYHHKPHFYHRESLYLSYEDDRPIDIEMCPRCQNVRLVYDCPVAGCQGKDQATQLCRACTLCISRCVQCGKCINDDEYVETFCLEVLCVVCSKQGSQFQEMQDVGGSHSRYAFSQEPAISFHG